MESALQVGRKSLKKTCVFLWGHGILCLECTFNMCSGSKPRYPTHDDYPKRKVSKGNSFLNGKAKVFQRISKIITSQIGKTKLIVGYNS